MVAIPKQICEKFNNPNAIKILGTVDSDGTPNVAIVGSLFVVDPERLGFADMQLLKTKKNLQATKKAAVLLWVPPAVCYELKGTFEGWQTTGPLYEALNSSSLLRYMTAVNARGVGTIKIDSIFLSQLPLPGRRIA